MIPDAKITDVAVIFEGEIYSLPAPNRHHNVIHMMYGNGIRINGPSLEGFLDENGTFLNRSAGMIRAQRNGQLNRREGDQFYQGPDLYSEDLW